MAMNEDWVFFVCDFLYSVCTSSSNFRAQLYLKVICGFKKMLMLKQLNHEKIELSGNSSLE